MGSTRIDDLRYQLKREKAHIKSVRRRLKFVQLNKSRFQYQKYLMKKDRKLLKNIGESFFKDLQPFLEPGTGDLKVIIPDDFSFVTGYNTAIRTIKQFATSLYEFPGQEITLDFSSCKKADSAALFVMQIVRLEIEERLIVLQGRIKTISVLPRLDVLPPKDRDVSRLLIVSGFPNKKPIADTEGESTLEPINAMGYYKGTKSQKHYLENKKSVYSTKVVTYLDSCLGHHEYMLTDDEKQDIDGIIGEVLNNAEDHSGKNNWFMTANFSKELFDTGDEEVGELNLTIMNFGNTIYEAFVNTKNDNMKTYTDVCGYVEDIHSTEAGRRFSEEGLMVLATMQDQISRLKFAEPSRGTGTMRFINSFLKLGDFENKEKNFVPNLSIFSGKVHLKCDNIYKPFPKETVYCLSLNAEQDLKQPPAESHLMKLGEKFPGTLLSVKIYINKAHYDKKYGGPANGNI